VRDRQNTFAALMEAVKTHSPGKVRTPPRRWRPVRHAIAEGVMGNLGIEHGNRSQVAVRSYWDGSARLLELGEHADPRGRLVEFDFARLPFQPRRSFVVHGADAGMVRGGHAHARGQQLLVCLAGTVLVDLRRGDEAQQIELSSPTLALLLNPGIWAQQRYGGPDAILLVLASHPYDPGSYIAAPP
jgi:hypothetical protein